MYLLRRRLSHGHPAMQQRVAVCDKFNSHFAHLLQKRDNRHFHPLLLLLLPIVLAVDGRDMARIAHYREGALQTVITENNSKKNDAPTPIHRGEGLIIILLSQTVMKRISNIISLFSIPHWMTEIPRHIIN